jgi:hypothetical protein
MRTADPASDSAPPRNPQVALTASARSLLRYAPALVLLIVVLADSVQYADTDLWGHIRFGQLILSQRHLIRQAPFAYSMSPPGPSWIDHEWLSQIMMAVCYEAAGVAGLKLWKFVCAGATVMLLGLAQAETGASIGVQFVVLAAAVGALVPQMQFRPQLFDYVALAAIVAILARESGGRRAPLWLAVPILMLWANVHAGFVVELGVLAVYTVVTFAVDRRRGAGTGRTLRLGSVALVAAATTFVNPYGPRLWLVLLETLRSPFTMRRVAEYQPLLSVMRSSLGGGVPIFSLVCFLGMLSALVICLVAAPSLEDFGLVAAAFLLSAGALYAVRNVALAAIVIAAPLARHASSLAAPGRKLEISATRAGRLRLHAPIQGVMVALAIALAIHQGLFSSTLRAAEAEPVGAIEFMRTHHLCGNVLCAYAWGVYVIWHQAPRSRVFIDSFEIMFPRKVRNDYLAFNDARRGAEHVLNEYPNDFVLMPTGAPAYTLMMAQASWRLIYRDPVAALFARSGSSAAGISGVPVLRAVAPPSFFP